MASSSVVEGAVQPVHQSPENRLPVARHLGVTAGLVVVAVLVACTGTGDARSPRLPSAPSTATPAATSTPSLEPTASPTSEASAPLIAPLDPAMAAALPSELVGISFQVVGIDPETTVGNIYDPAIGAAIARHFKRPTTDLRIALARAQDEEARRGIVGFEILAIRMPAAPVAQVVGAYLAAAISRPGATLQASGLREIPEMALLMGSGWSSLVWSDDTLYILSFSEQRALEMYEASPPESPIVDIYDLQAEAAAHLGLAQQSSAPLPTLLPSPAPAAEAPDLEALLPDAVDARPMDLYGSWATLEQGVDYFTLPAALIAQQTGRPLADASAALAVPSDARGHAVTVIRFEGLTGEQMLADVLAQWYVDSGPPSSELTGGEADGQRFLSTDGWALIARDDVLYWVALAPASSGPDMAEYTVDVIRSLP